MSSVKRFKKGERLFSEGGMVDRVFFIQSGRVQLFIERSGKRIELEVVSASQVLGEQAVFGSGKQVYNAEAVSEVRALEVPVEIIRAQHEKSGAGIKILSKTLCDEVKRARNTIKSFKLDQDPSPCPLRFVPRMFGVINLVAHHIGNHPEAKKTEGFVMGAKDEAEEEENPLFKDTDLIVPWTSLKIYTSRFFLESNTRMETLLNLLEKLKYVSLKRQPDDEDENVLHLTEVRIHNIELIEHFGEFYQHNLFKAGRAEVIIVDTLAMQIAEVLIELTEDLEADRNGVVQIKYDELVEAMRDDFELELRDTHLNILEKKGLYVNRRSRDTGDVFLSFDRKEFMTILSYWQIIHEVDKWNAKGFVDMNEDLSRKKRSPSTKCPGCKAKYEEGQNFCGTCGYKLLAEEPKAA